MGRQGASRNRKKKAKTSGAQGNWPPQSQANGKVWIERAPVHLDNVIDQEGENECKENLELWRISVPPKTFGGFLCTFFFSFIFRFDD